MNLLHQFLDIFISNWEIVLSFFVIAIVYSSVGFGGGSSYLAVLSLFSLPFGQLRAIALICNIAVVSGNILVYQRNKKFNWKKVLPLVLISIPLAFLGGKLRVEKDWFFTFLGFVLIVASLFMWASKYVKSSKEISRDNNLKDYAYGGTIGFISGMAGLGGGIFLAPLLHLTKWDTPKKIAASSSLFIFVNSVSGLVGQSQNPDFYVEPFLTSLLIATVFIGGQIGSRLNEKIISPLLLKQMTAVLVLVVGLRLLFKYLL